MNKNGHLYCEMGKKEQVPARAIFVQGGFNGCCQPGIEITKITCAGMGGGNPNRPIFCGMGCLQFDNAFVTLSTRDGQ